MLKEYFIQSLLEDVVKKGDKVYYYNKDRTRIFGTVVEIYPSSSRCKLKLWKGGTTQEMQMSSVIKCKGQ